MDLLKKLLDNILTDLYNVAKKWGKKRYGDKDIVLPTSVTSKRRRPKDRVLEDVKHFSNYILSFFLFAFILIRLIKVFTRITRINASPIEFVDE
ncbi:hypothetical protein ACFLXI_10460, partial [Chloroflexota bacterium]